MIGLAQHANKAKVPQMWFQILSSVIAAALIGKSAIALTSSRWFYAQRQRQYATEALPTKLLIAPVVVFALALVAWYATVVHYRPWAWIVTGFLTALSCMAVDHVLRWSRHRQKMLKVVASPKVWRVDCLLMVLGVGFVALAVLVY